MTYSIDRCPCEESPRLGAMAPHPVAESVPRARHWFRKLLTPYRPNCSVDDCVLLLSELVTNAVVHGTPDGPWLVQAEWFRVGTSLLVEVHNPGLPESVRLRRPDADDAHGRGLLLVASLADSWHSGPSRFGGTVVSFRMAGAWSAP
ncbi:ATP-binding protein [Streptomyces olivaceus]|uniref:ATP-binding protein n=1 Tax=Streptomyces olivaceus TaxID=47716 RepID=UPI001CC9DA27|nr:ATP-binding protein [Streptomyces olivaceus]MBZ6083509.1 ATP-binding protein [Streptomyces olivaceus]